MEEKDRKQRRKILVEEGRMEMRPCLKKERKKKSRAELKWWGKTMTLFITSFFFSFFNETTYPSFTASHLGEFEITKEKKLKTISKHGHK